MPGKSPLIGICGYEVPAAFAHWTGVECVMIPSGYTRAVAAAGGVPLVMAPLPASLRLLDVIDGIVFSGGSDIESWRYGRPQHAESLGAVPHRDQCEVELLAGALERDLPLLGICRGMQLLNVVLGGDLDQHIDDGGLHKAEPGTFSRHPVAVEPGTRLAGLTGDLPAAHSCHHQAPGRMGARLVVSAVAPDGVVEAVELPGRSFAVGVLWHPEEDPVTGASLFDELVDQARGVVAAGRRE